MGLVISTLLFHPPETPTQLATNKYFWLTTSRGSKIPASFIQQPNARFTILYSHGNAEDLGMIHSYMVELSKLLYVNVLAYDYSGYGLGMKRTENIENNVEPSEENCYADIEAAFDYLTNIELINPQHIVLYGRSVGSGPSCYLAQKLSRKEKGVLGVGGMILHSPFLSVCRVVVDVGIENAFDVFPNVSRVRDVTCPVFIMHGTKDDVVPFYHGRNLYEALPENIQYCSPFWAENMGHNNIEADMTSLFIKKLKRFLLNLLKTQDPEALEKKLYKLGIETQWTQAQITFDESQEEETTTLLPKSKLSRNKSPQSVLDMTEERHPANSTNIVKIEARVSSFESQVECIAVEHRSP